VACWSARFGDAWAQATRHKPQAEASPAGRQGNAHARSRRNYSVFWHRAAAAKQRRTRKLPARQGVQWVGRRAPSGIDRAKQEASHRSVVFSNACVALAPVALLQNDHGHGQRQAARWRVHGQAEGAVLCRRAPLTRATQRAIRVALTCIGQLTLESQPAWVTQRGWLGEIINSPQWPQRLNYYLTS